MLRLSNISKSFGEKKLFDSFSLSVAKGRKVLIQGASGCGKSTLLKMILGFARPDAGDIFIDDQRLSSHTVWQLRRQVAYVSQEPELEDGIGEDLVIWGLRFSANSHLAGEVARIPEWLAAFGLPESVLKQRGEELSGGEKQRLMMMSAMILQRPLILLDEPSSALDPNARKKSIEFFKSQKELTVLAVSHDREWEGFADEVITLGEEP